MAKILALIAATSSLLVGSSLAASNTTNCSADVTKEAVGEITNVTYLNTCAPGSKWQLKTLFDAANLSTSDFMTFCNATQCMTPMHKLLAAIPEGCVVTVDGKSVELNAAVAAVHDKCHMSLHKVEGSHHDDDDDDDDHAHTNSSAGNSSANKTVPTPTPAPTKSAATTISRTTLTGAIAIATAASTIVAMVL